ncbi:MAG TPA: adenylate/guanylate cyclase domain-containing protein [Solirubrobacterales bacterium]
MTEIEEDDGERAEIAKRNEAARETTIAKLAAALKRTDEQPRLLMAAKLARELLRGDSRYGDPLSTAGSNPSQKLGRRLSALTAERPSLLGEIGLSALQVWESISAQGADQGERELAILFTDLVDFSDWSLRAGDTMAVELLREVGSAIEPSVIDHDGVVVKRLGDGLMAAFEDPAGAVAAALEARDAVAEVEVDGYQPRMRAGIHIGHPRRLGGDYLGTDVNIAARVAEAASGGEVLVSDAVRERLDEGAVKLKRRRFKAKGAPSGLSVYAVEMRK